MTRKNRSKTESGENWEQLNARAEEIVDRTTRMKRKQLAIAAKGGARGTGGAEQREWNRLLDCPTIPADGSYEDFKILAETFQVDVKTLMDMHRYDLGKNEAGWCSLSMLDT